MHPESNRFSRAPVPRSWLKKVMLLLLLSSSVMAVEDIVSFSDESLRPRYQQLLEELRCPKCQNQNLSDSNSPISDDLRREIHRLLEEGATDHEIKEYLKSRYSEFILYRPEVNSATWFLWSAPVALLVLGLVILSYFSRRGRQRLEASPEVKAPSSEERQRLAALLGNPSGTNENPANKSPEIKSPETINLESEDPKQ